MCLQPITGLFQEAASTAMTTLSGAAQISGMVFLLLSWVAGMPSVGRRGAYLAHAAAVGPAGI